jgi:hypothetical protein
MRKILAAFGLLLLAAMPADAALCLSVPYIFVNGVTADAGQVNANFTTLLGCLNNSTAHSGANSDITSLSALTAPPTGTGSLVFSGVTLTNVMSGSTTAITVGVTNPNGFALNYGNILVFTPTVNNTTTYPKVTLSVVAAPTVNLYKWSMAGPIALTGNELVNGQVAQAIYDGTEFVLISQVVVPVIVTPLPEVRITLSTGVPVLPSTVTGATTIYADPYGGNQIPVWNGSTFTPTTFAELSQALSDTTLSPAAAVAGSLYDMFIWSNSGTLVVSRGTAWTNPTTRAVALSRVQGLLVNTTSIANGPAAGYGVYIGTVATDPGAATVSFNPLPAAASGGPTGGAWVGLWNEYGRVPLGAVIQDSKASWTWNTASWHAADASTNNRITFVAGLTEDQAVATYTVEVGVGSSIYPIIGIGFDSSTAATGGISQSASSAGYQFLTAIQVGEAVQGQHYFQALEYSPGGATSTFYGTSAQGSLAGVMQLSAQLRY